MRIGIDCRLCGPEHAGIGRYILQLAVNLYLLHPDCHWVLFYSTADQAKLLNSTCPKAQLVGVPIRHYTVREQLKLPKMFHQHNLDLLHVPHFNAPLLYRGKLVLTIHDLLWHEYRGAHVTTLSPLVYWCKYVVYRFVVKQNIQRAHHILVPSKTVQHTLGALFTNVTKKITVTPEAALLPENAKAIPRLPPNYWLYVGSLYPHKNIQVVLQALQKLPDQMVVIATSRSVFTSQTLTLASSLGVRDQLRVIYHSNDAELLYLYQHAQVLLQPSLSEGFGLTGLEAMAAGCPVVCSDIPIFHEVYGQAAMFFSPFNPQDLLVAVEGVQKHTTSMKKLGTHQSQLYSWSKTAATTWQVYQHVISHTPS